VNILYGNRIAALIFPKNKFVLFLLNGIIRKIPEGKKVHYSTGREGIVYYHLYCKRHANSGIQGKNMYMEGCKV
jgi:hypothetical protein